MKIYFSYFLIFNLFVLINILLTNSNKFWAAILYLFVETNSNNGKSISILSLKVKYFCFRKTELNNLSFNSNL